MINDILNIISVSGNEEKMKEYIIDNIKSYCDEYYIDNIGNLIVHQKGTSEKTLISTSIDEEGYLVTHIDEDGIIKFSPLTNVSPYHLINKKVYFIDKEIYGIIICNEDLELEKLKLSDLSVDVGCEKTIEPGDIFAIVGDNFSISDRIYGNNLSKKAGIYILIQSIIKTYKKSNLDLYYTFTIEDLLGFKGAKVAAQVINPKKAYIVGSSNFEKDMPCLKLGKGPIIKIKDNFVITNKDIRDAVINVMKNNNIPYQLEISSKSNQYSGEIMYLNDGILTVMINYFTKYNKFFYESITMSDIDNIINVLVSLFNEI